MVREDLSVKSVSESRPKGDEGRPGERTFKAKELVRAKDLGHSPLLFNIYSYFLN